jgi:hypothetical protein
MTAKGMKPAIARPSARDALAAAHTVAQQAGLPPAALTPTNDTGADDLVQVNIRVRRGLGDQLADRAKAEHTTQKVLICRALATAGFAVHSADVQASPPPRRRGRASN